MSRISKPFEFPDRFDASTKHGAGVLADCIRVYWAAKGFAVHTERFEVREGAWGISSDLVNGLPRARSRA